MVYQLKLARHTLHLSARTHIMGILNVTPDSFSDGGQFLDPERAVAQARQMVADGADIIDIGAESTRPGSEPVSLDDEWQRIEPVLRALTTGISVPISIDTYKSTIARRALKMGASIVNDISGLRFDPDMARTIAEFDAACVIMHIKGTPRNMQKDPHYDDVMAEIGQYLQDGIRIAEQNGVDPAKIILDPGIGFGKRFGDNVTIHRQLQDLQALGKPILFGSSRKSFLQPILGVGPSERLEGTVVSNVVAVLHGAHIIRVHDVKPLKRAMQTLDALVFNSLETA